MTANGQMSSTLSLVSLRETNEKVLQEIEQNDERVETQKSNKKDAKT